ncbi:MAG: hypothetical protein HY556_10625 [Euryarchaeota archaeon]|nr:hypothetical protein [Euryarchaeota archaeon]
MNNKVLELVRLVESGFEIRKIQDQTWSGGLILTLSDGKERRRMQFDAYEIPAVLQECTVTGKAG